MEIQNCDWFAFDFDSTLGKVSGDIDNQMLQHIQQSTGLSRDILEMHLPTINPFSLQVYIRALSAHHSHDWNITQTLQSLTRLLSDEFTNILYSDSQQVLTKLRKSGFKLAVITYGGQDYQNLKIQATGIPSLVDSIHITQEPFQKAKNIKMIIDQSHARKFTYIDDTEAELDAIKQSLGDRVSLFKMQRDPSKQGGQSNRYPIIRSLSELLSN